MKNDSYYKVCKRKNNSKRGYLLVNPRQAKHIPVNPKKFFSLTKRMTKALKESVDIEKSKNILVIGFAETATALGLSVAENLLKPGRNVYYITTTREHISGFPFVDFSEEHSHATEQRLYLNSCPEEMVEADEVIFVEDEISTGKTIKNIVNKIRSEKLLKNKTDNHIKVLSVLNGMSDDALSLFKSDGMEFVYLERIDNSNYDSLVEDIDTTTKRTTDFRGNYCDCNKLNKLNMHPWGDVRLGVDVRQYMYEMHTFISVNIVKYLDSTEINKNSVVDVVGTEECMYPAIEFAGELKYLGIKNVKTHSTTRSPIEVSSKKGYAIKNCAVLGSMYEDSRVNYLYNLRKDVTHVIIISDGRNACGLESLMSAFLACGENNITLVQINCCNEVEGKNKDGADEL